MALQKIPNVTLHRASLANAARIVRLNMADATVAIDADIIATVPVLAPYPKSVGNFFKIVGEILEDAGAITTKRNVRYYRNDINSALRQINFAFFLLGGSLPEDSPPVQILAMPQDIVFTTAAQTHDFSQYFSGGDTYSISTLPSKFSWVSATGVLTYDTDDAAGGFNPFITAHNANGDTKAAETADISYS